MIVDLAAWPEFVMTAGFTEKSQSVVFLQSRATHALCVWTITVCHEHVLQRLFHKPHDEMRMTPPTMVAVNNKRTTKTAVASEGSEDKKKIKNALQKWDWNVTVKNKTKIIWTRLKCNQSESVLCPQELKTFYTKAVFTTMFAMSLMFRSSLFQHLWKCHSSDSKNSGGVWFTGFLLQYTDVMHQHARIEQYNNNKMNKFKASMQEAAWTSFWQDLSAEAVVLLKMMSQKIPYVNLWVTARTHYFWAIFILETTKRAHIHTHTHKDSFSSRDLFSNIHQCDAHITHAWIHTQTHMRTYCQQDIYHPVKPLTLLIIYRYSICYDLTIIHHYTEKDRIILIYFIRYLSLSKQLKPLIGKDCRRRHYGPPSNRIQ